MSYTARVEGLVNSTTHNPMVKRNVLWITLNVLCLKQRKGNKNRRDTRYISLFAPNNAVTVKSRMSSAETVIGQKLWTTLADLCPENESKGKTHPKNKTKTFSVGTPVFASNYRPWEPNWISCTIHKKKSHVYL